MYSFYKREDPPLPPPTQPVIRVVLLHTEWFIQSFNEPTVSEIFLVIKDCTMFMFFYVKGWWIFCDQIIAIWTVRQAFDNSIFVIVMQFITIYKRIYF